MSTYYWKDLWINFIIGFLFLVKEKSNNYDLILVIIDYLTKIVDYKPVKITINIIGLIKIIIGRMVRYHDC